MHAAPLPERRRRREGPPEAAPDGRAGVGRDGPRLLPALRPARRRAVRDRAGERDLGGADVDGRVPPVELAPRRRRAARRVADRPRPDARVPVLDASAGSRASRTRCSTSSAPSAGRRPRAARASTSTCGSSRAGASATCAAPRWRSRARSSAALPIDVTTTWWRKDRDPTKVVRRLQPERPRPHDRQRLLGPRRPVEGDGLDADRAGTSSTTSSPRELTIATVPGAVRPARRPPRRDRRRASSTRAAARVGGPRRARRARRPGRGPGLDRRRRPSPTRPSRSSARRRPRAPRRSRAAAGSAPRAARRACAASGSSRSSTRPRPSARTHQRRSQSSS